MRHRHAPTRTILLLTTLLLLSANLSFAAGLLKPLQGGDQSALAISAHHVDVVINNGFVRTEVDQTFANPGTAPLEGLYSFPLPKQASLSELSLWIAGREILGEVVEKERATQIYEEQKAQGKQTALAEKNDYRTFEVKVGNIPAQGDVRVRLVYYQPLEIDLNVGRFLYPLAEGNVDDERLAFWAVDDQVAGPFTFHLQLKSAFPVKDVRLPGYDQEAVIQRNGDVIDVVIDRPQGGSLGQDIVFYYRLDDSVPARVELVPYKPDSKSDGTFLLVVTPAADLQPISEGSDWTFVLDVSGSMGGAKLATLSRGVHKVLGQMRPNDRFRIITFSDSARDLTGGYLAATPENVQEWLARVAALQSEGGTNLYAGLELAYRKLDDDRTTGVILVTDGVANIGPTAHRDFLKLLADCDLRLFTFVIGNSANQPLLDRLARESGGFAMNLSDQDDIGGRLLQAKARVLHQNLHDVRITLSGERVTELTPQALGNLYLGQQAVQFGRYHGSGEVTITMTGKISGEERQWQTTALLPEVATDNPELERLWALAKIDERMQQIREDGENETLRRQVTELGIDYALVTDYTSMLVVTDDVRESQGLGQRNAERVARERAAQQQRATQPVANHRVDSNRSAFDNRPAPSFGHGSGPVGLFAIPLAAWLNRRKRQ